MPAHLVTIFWRDIPSQVNGQIGRTRVAAPLDDRFQVAIDKAAMVADITDSDAYIAEWRRSARPCSDDLAAEATAEAERIDTEYTPARIKHLVANGGFEHTITDEESTPS